ncbi:Acetyl-CoA acetyltransferase [Symmachiella macrocystis]|uniref:Acetyl-CoA acetyltransferase n=1 Tax=Symmachiella macrocystis TaxID=2527985 RepID=A0A5C6BST5_9PLAN|nr:acetyl-CoA C-acetyltransferase [Symmachiella macrocystis]TWU14812.1 Acetyl-CoA acetyltransferase [Symmachiella macrocystis]
MTTDAYVIAGCRTPIGKFLGVFRDIPAPELGAICIREALRRSEINPAQVDEVIMGNILSAGLGQAPARQAALKAGIPAGVAALTINKMCGSGLKAVMLADQAIRLGDANVIIAGGMENMTRAPHLIPGMREGLKFGNGQHVDSMLYDGLWCTFHDCGMGEHAEATSAQNDVSREDQDEFSAASQQRAARATAEGEFDEEIVPVAVRKKRDEIQITADEGPRPGTTAEVLSKLRPAFSAEGTVTAGNSSMLSDGASAVVVANKQIADASPAPYKARIVAAFTSGVEPRDIFIAPVAAVRGVLNKAGLSPDDIDLYELNEAFAAQMLACMKQLELDPQRVNVNGGAIALGHPIGASGARILVTLIAALKRRGLRRGLASLCLGGGNAVAMIVECEA